MRNEFSDIFPSRILSYLKIVKGERRMAKMRNEFSDIFPSRILSYPKIVKGESFFQRKQCIWLLPTLTRL